MVWEAEDIFLNNKSNFFKVYKGDELYWQESNNISTEKYLVIECTNEAIEVQYISDGYISPVFYISTTGEDGSFTRWNLSTKYLSKGQKLYLYGNNSGSISAEYNHFDIRRVETTDSSFGTVEWGSSTNNGKAKIYGNLKALTNINIPYLQYNYEFYGLFMESDAIEDCSGLVLPFGSKTMAFKKMFYKCSNLSLAPEIPKMNMNNNMYEGMFYNCRSLKEITCLTYSPSTDACFDWLYGAGSSSTTFTKRKGVSWVRANNGIPSKFTIIEK